ncbi:MAG: Ig-like domain-containing protein, partial [Actinomycetota bacterium]
VFEVSSAVPNTDISSTYGAAAGWLDLGINWFTVTAVEASGLTAAITAAGALDVGTYTTSSWTTAGVADAIAAAQAVLDNPASTQADVDAAIVALNEAIALVVPRGNPDTLNVLIAVGEALDGKLGAFTDASVEAFDEALEAAQLESAAAADRTQAQLVVAANALQAAIDGLTVKAPTVNKVALQTLRDTVKGFTNPKNTYTTPSWKAFQTELAAAAVVLQSSSATQASVDAATANLSEAVAGLQILDKSPLKIKLNQSQLRLPKGKQLRLEDGLYFRDVLPASYSGKVTWKTSNSKVATVSSDGLVTAKKAGTVTITVTSKDVGSSGKQLATSIKVSVVSKASSAKVTKVTATVPRNMAVGAIAYTTGTYQSSSATGIKVSYSSANSSVVAIDKAGRIVAKAPGTTQITVKAGTKTIKYTVTVS